MRLRVLHLAYGMVDTPFDGQWLKEYDPGRDGADANGEEMAAHLVTTPIYDDALVLPTVEMFHLYTKVDPRAPVLRNGRPNAPLTAFTVEFRP